MNEKLPSPEEAFNTITNLIMELPTKVGAKEQTDRIWLCLQSLRNLVEADVDARKTKANTGPEVALPVAAN